MFEHEGVKKETAKGRKAGRQEGRKAGKQLSLDSL
jgi:hypothetical protein